MSDPIGPNPCPECGGEYGTHGLYCAVLLNERKKVVKKQIVVTGTFVGFHKWPEAPNEVSYLRELHRHLFTFKVYFEVTHNERQLEFYIQKEKVATIIWSLPESHDVYAWSCETWAEKILNACIHHNDPVTKVEIWEDNECGAIVEKV